MKGRVLSIAGSDSGGGAGIQADIKAVTAMGAYCATAVTSVTVQNTQGVLAVHPLPSQLIRDQMDAVLGDLGADAIKIGMIGTVEAGEVILAGMAGSRDIPVVVDPVLVATTGARLGDDAVAEFLRTRLIPRGTLVTPNLAELEALTGRPVSSEGQALEAARYLLGLGVEAVLAKGGHGEGDTLTDYLVTEDDVRRFTHPRIDTTHTHGTGCTLASAIAAGIAQGMKLPSSVERACAFVHDAIGSAPGLGRGHGPLNHATWLEAGRRPSA